MSDFCASLQKQDAAAFALCETLAQEGATLKTLDQGYSRLDFRQASKPARVTEEAGNGALSPPEVYDAFLRFVEDEEDRRVRATSQKMTKPPTFDPKRLKFLKEKGETIVPWVFDDLNPKTTDDEKLFLQALKRIEEIKKDLKGKKLSEGTAEHSRALAEALLDFLQATPKKGGLELVYDPDGSHPARSFGDVLRERKMNCLEFLYLYLALGRMAGLSVFPIDVFRNAKGDLLEHVAMALRYDPKDPQKILFLDIAVGKASETPAGPWAELSRMDLIAYFYNSQATTADKEKAGDLYLKALRYAPLHYMALSNYGGWLEDVKGQLKEAEKFLLQAEKVNPQYPFPYLGLEKVYTRQGLTQKATAAHQKAEELFKVKTPKP
ncbi:MAG: hypothetical protein U1F57_09105 [bacterium]